MYRLFSLATVVLRNNRGVIAPVFVLPVRAFDAEFSGSKPASAAASEAVKSAARGASARPEHLSP
jgi:hypothetical protein